MAAHPKVFVTGVTGYVGGDALVVILKAHPDWNYTFLVRDAKRVEGLTSTYPHVRMVVGDVSDTDLLKRETIAADVILTFHSSDDATGARAIRSALQSDQRKRFWIHTSGTANLIFEDINSGVLGQLNSRVWDDQDDIEEINQWPETVLHRPVEKIVLEAGNGYENIRTAVVCPPAIVGPGRGPGNRRTIQVPIMIELIRRRKRAFQINEGRARWGFVHIHDLSDVYLCIAEAAARGGAGADWGQQGWYFAENGELAWGAISHQISRCLCAAGELSSQEVDSMSTDEAYKVFGSIGPGMAGANSRSRATRTRRVLGWSPKVSDLELAIDEEIGQELRETQSRLDDFAQGHMPVPPPRRNRSNI